MWSDTRGLASTRHRPNILPTRPRLLPSMQRRACKHATSSLDWPLALLQPHTVGTAVITCYRLMAHSGQAGHPAPGPRLQGP